MSLQPPTPAPILAFRQGECPKYYTDRPSGVAVFAVCLIKVPLPPEPREPGVKDITVLCAGQQGMDNHWGWVQLESGSKEIVAHDLEEFGTPLGKWVYVQMAYPPEQMEEIPDGNP